MDLLNMKNRAQIHEFYKKSLKPVLKFSDLLDDGS